MANRNDFVLATELMTPIAEDCKKLANRMRSLKNELDNAQKSLMFYWAGKGRNEFEKQYRLLSQQLTDLIDDTWDMHEKLVNAEQAYIQSDVDAAKQAEGVSNRF